MYCKPIYGTLERVVQYLKIIERRNYRLPRYTSLRYNLIDNNVRLCLFFIHEDYIYIRLKCSTSSIKSKLKSRFNPLILIWLRLPRLPSDLEKKLNKRYVFNNNCSTKLIINLTYNNKHREAKLWALMFEIFENYCTVNGLQIISTIIWRWCQITEIKAL